MPEPARDRSDLVRALLARRRPAAGEPPAGPDILSPAQRRLWFVHHMDPASPAFNESLVIRLEGAVDEPRLRRAIAEILRRHRVLRTVFPARDGQPAPHVTDGPAPFVILDLSAWPPEAVEAAVERILARELARPFDLGRGPLVRCLLLRTRAGERILACFLHHIVADAWSGGVLVSELATLYRGYANGERSPLPDLKTQYADYARWQHGWLSDERLDALRRYWRRRLAGVTRFELPREVAGAAGPGRCGSVPFHYSAAQTAAVAAACRSEQATLFVALAAAFMFVLSHHADRREVVVGTDVAGRSHVDAEPLIGFFVNQIVLRLSLAGVATVRDLLRGCRTMILEALDHQDMPFEELVRELSPERSRESMPLFDCKIVLQNVPRPPCDLPDVTMTPVRLPPREAQYQLTWTMAHRDGGLDGAVNYDPRRLSRRRAETIASDLASTLTLMAANADVPLAGVRRQLERRATTDEIRIARQTHRARGARWTARVRPPAQRI